MKILASGRQSGRTTELIKLCAEAEARGEVSYIVCHNQSEAYRIARLAEKKELTIGFPLTYDEFMQKQYHGAHISNFFIDNTEMLLQHLTHVRIAAITILKEDDD